MAQASVLTDTEIRRVFRIIDTTRHAGRNRVAFALSIFAGLRVGEIAELIGRRRCDTRMARSAAKSNLARIRQKDRRDEPSYYPSEFERRSVHSSIITPRGSMVSHSLRRSAVDAVLYQCYTLNAIQGNL